MSRELFLTIVTAALAVTAWILLHRALRAIGERALHPPHPPGDHGSGDRA